MAFTTLISAEQTRDLLATQAPLVLLDCGFDLTDTDGRGARLDGGPPARRVLRPSRP